MHYYILPIKHNKKSITNVKIYIKLCSRGKRGKKEKMREKIVQGQYCIEAVLHELETNDPTNWEDIRIYRSTAQQTAEYCYKLAQDGYTRISVRLLDRKKREYIPCEITPYTNMRVDDSALKNKQLWNGFTVEVLETNEGSQRKKIRLYNTPQSTVVWISNTKLRRIGE